MKFGIEECAMPMIRSRKRQLSEETEVPNQQKIRTLGEKEIYNYLGIMEADTIKQAEIKKKLKKRYIRRTKKLLESNLYSRNLIRGINTWDVLLVRYSGPFLK